MSEYVYLGGPILGCNRGEANDWRHNVADQLSQSSIVGISPLRCEPLHGETYQVSTEDPRFGTARAIASKNLFDVTKCDMVLIYLPAPPPGRHQSFGSLIELAWAKALGKQTILVSDDPDILLHPVVNACAGWVLTTLDEAVDVIVGILGGYAGGKNV